MATNYHGYWHRYRWLIFAACVASFVDAASTMHFMHRDGIHYEVHPIIRTAAQLTGPVVGPVIGKLFQLAALFIVTLYSRRIAPHLFIITAAVYFWAGWFNYWGRDIYAMLPSDWLAQFFS